MRTCLLRERWEAFRSSLDYSLVFLDCFFSFLLFGWLSLFRFLLCSVFDLVRVAYPMVAGFFGMESSGISSLFSFNPHHHVASALSPPLDPLIATS